MIKLNLQKSFGFKIVGIFEPMTMTKVCAKSYYYYYYSYYSIKFEGNIIILYNARTTLFVRSLSDDGGNTNI